MGRLRILFVAMLLVVIAGPVAVIAWQAPPNSEKKAQTKEQTVYITRTGKKYHRDGCRHLRSRIPTTLTGAIEAGYTACSVCRPPE